MQIAENAGKNGGVVLNKILEKPKDELENFGYNAATDEYEDLTKAGVIDPTKVVITAFKNAVSAAMMFLMVESVVSEIPEEKKGGGMPGGMPQMPMGGMGGF